MNRLTANTLILSALLLCVACSIDEVDDPVPGVLHFRAQDNLAPGTTVPGSVELDDGRNYGFNAGTEYLAIPDILPGTTYQLDFTPTVIDDWLSGGTLVYELPEGVTQDTLVHVLTRRVDSLITAQVHFKNGDVELTGFPLRINGLAWSQSVPCQIQVAGGMSHTLVIGNGNCSVASLTMPGYDEQPLPVPEFTIELGPEQRFNFSSAGATGVEYFVDGQRVQDSWYPETGQGNHFLAAYAPGSIFDPPYRIIDDICPQDLDFTASPLTEGYDPGELFTDFTMMEVLPEAGTELGEYSLRQSRGKVVLLSFWSLTCVPCLEEMPFINQLVGEYGPEIFEVLAINSYPNEDAEDFPVYDFHYLLDRGSPPLAALVQLGALPQNYILRRDGSIRSLHGSLSEELLRDIIEELE